MENKRNSRDKYKKIIVEIFRIAIGLIFVFSGFVKAVDPLGSTYKFVDYFTAFNLEFLNFLALPGSFFLSALEFILGVCLLAGVYRKITSLIIVLFMGFMTCLTLYLAIANPVSDCGCFGDAIVISNWGTFIKNILILPASILVFVWSSQMSFLFSKKSRSLVFVFSLVYILSVSTYCYINLPLLDFRPYKIGNNIREGMEIPEGVETDIFETTFIYEKEGIKQKFNLDNYPKEGSGWTFVDSESKLIKKGYEPPIHGFSISDMKGDDITDEILNEEGYTFLLIAHKLNKASDTNIDKINELYDYSTLYGYKFYCLTASLPEHITEWKESTGAEYPFCTMDDITLKTIVRSNPGVALIKNATIINKWADRNIPYGDILSMPLNETSLGEIPENKDTKKVIFLAFILIIPLCLLSFADWAGRKMDKKKELKK